jgi:predicted Zn-dependent peptidase
LRRTIFVGWCLGVLAGLVAAASTIDIPLERFELKNGLKVILVPRHETPVVYSLIRYNVGSANEHQGITGISHMLEHMMFKGTREIQTTNYEAETAIMEKQDALFQQILDLRQKIIRGEADDTFQKQISDLQLQIKGLNRTQKLITIQNDLDVATFRVGFSRLGADTSYDRTHYMEYFPANCLEAWAYFESARMREPVFREFYAERDVVSEERRQTKETQPAAMLYERFLATAVMAHSYHWDVIGWRSDIENWTREDVREYHRVYYAPNNAIVVLVGDFEIAAAKNLIHKYFGKIPAQPVTKPLAMTQEPPPLGEKRIKVHLDASPRLIIGYPRCQANHPDFPLFGLLDAILAHGRNSRLYNRLVKNEMAISFETGVWEMKRYPGLYTITAVAGEHTSISQLENTITEELNALKETPVTAETLDMARSVLTGQLLQRLYHPESMAVILAESEDLYGSPLAFNDYLSALERATPADILRLARQWLREDHRTVAWLVPVEKEDAP